MPQKWSNCKQRAWASVDRRGRPLLHTNYVCGGPADRESCRPDFAVALYPGHLWRGGDALELNPSIHPARNTPPTFLLQAENDNVDHVNQALTCYIAFKNAGVPAEMRLYEDGGHALGLRRTKLPVTAWPNLVETGLGMIGVL